MTLNTLKKNLLKKGLDARAVTLLNDTPGIMVYHDYTGLYPDKEVFKLHDIATTCATRNGFHAEERGHYSATLIY